MSLHTQLLRGLFALPVLLLLAVASVTAPAHSRHACVDAVAHARAIVLVQDGQVTVLARAGADAR